jgi:hypothetical protein
LTKGSGGVRDFRGTEEAKPRGQRPPPVPPPSGIWRLPILSWLRQEFLESNPTLEPLEKRGYALWIPLAIFIAVPEILAALSKHLKNLIPWPTISSMTGHLESMKDWVALIPVAIITMVAYHVASYPAERKEAGHALRRGNENKTRELPHGGVYVFLVLVAGAATALIAYAAGASKFRLGYALYSVLALLGIVVPSILSYWRGEILGAPPLFKTVADLQKRLHWVAVLLVAGLVVLLIHLALYPWPKFNHNPP